MGKIPIDLVFDLEELKSWETRINYGGKWFVGPHVDWPKESKTALRHMTTEASVSGVEGTSVFDCPPPS